ncbi:MAG: hypothetical protein ACK56I_23325, partial [bacterium]
KQDRDGARQHGGSQCQPPQQDFPCRRRRLGSSHHHPVRSQAEGEQRLGQYSPAESQGSDRGEGKQQRQPSCGWQAAPATSQLGGQPNGGHQHHPLAGDDGSQAVDPPSRSAGS